jgi:putative transposase
VRTYGPLPISPPAGHADPLGPGVRRDMWTEAHRVRHEPRLKELVSVYAVEEITRWLERADPPRSGRATPIPRVVGAIAWHLRVGGAWRSLPPGWPPWRTV